MGMRGAILLAGLLAPLYIPGAAFAAGNPGARGGESFIYTFSIGAIEGGRARMAIGRPTEHAGQWRMVVHGEAESAPWLSLIARFQDDYQVTFDPRTFLPLHVTETERGARNRVTTTTYSGRLTHTEAVLPGRPKLHGHHRLPRPARDPLSALFALRASPLENGGTLHFDVLDGNALWRTDAKVHRGVVVRLGDDAAAPQFTAGDTPHAKLGIDRKAIRIDGQAWRIDDAGRRTPRPARHYTLWISEDADRVLLRMESDTDFGKAALELTHYQRPPAAPQPVPPPTTPGLTASR